jgi:hypothetical protein
MTADYLENLPDPEIVARAAADEAAPRVLEDYCEAIQILREKRFTFREIAEWLGKNFNIQADHNSVWRAHTKYMDDFSAHMEAEEDERVEQDEALANGTSGMISPTPVPATKTTVAEQAQTEIPKAASQKAKRNKKK